MDPVKDDSGKPIFPPISELVKAVYSYSIEISKAAYKRAPIGPTGQLRRGIRAKRPIVRTEGGKTVVVGSIVSSAINSQGEEYATKQHDEVLRHFQTAPITKGFSSLGTSPKDKGRRSLTLYDSGYDLAIATGQYVRYATKYLLKGAEDVEADKDIADIIGNLFPD